MATIRSYTTVEQSKKLAEILPLESADMYYHNRVDIPDNFPLPIEWKHNNPLLSQEIPCWSLAALMDVIPYNVSFNKAVYRFKMVKYSEHWECYHENFGSVSTEIFKGDNQIDACVAMIEKLHEQNLM